MERIMTFKWKAALWLSVLLLIFFKCEGYANETADYTNETADYINETKDYAMDYSNIDALIASLEDSENISFSQLVSQLISGEIDFSFQEIFNWLLKKIVAGMSANKNVMIQIIAISVIGAVFANFSEAFSKKYVAETGFYLTYMVMFLLLAASFAISADIAAQVVDRLLSFMKVLVPAFCAAVTLALGVTTSQAWYQLLMMLIVVADWAMARFLMRFIYIFVILSMVNHMLHEDFFSKMTELFQVVIVWSVRTILGITLGMNLIQGMVLPAFDSVKNGVFTKVTSAIPGLGDALGAAAKAAIGSGVLLKNAVGTAGVMIVCVLCAWPLIQLLAAVLMYKLMEALIQPISDKRIVACIHAVGEGILLLLKSTGAVILLFIISLAMMTSISNVAV